MIRTAQLQPHTSLSTRMRSRSDRSHKKPAAVSLFSGAGGFCEGVRLAGYDVICAVENDRDASRTHAANFPEVPLFAEDIRRFLRDEKLGVPGKRILQRGQSISSTAAHLARGSAKSVRAIPKIREIASIENSFAS